MAIRTKLLNGNNITRDTDFSKFIQTVSEPGVIEGFTVTANSVAVGQARVPCERTNGETLYALIYNTAPVSISGNGEVYILVNQTYIDDGELANEDGTGIATIQVGTTPSKNALKLATITNGVVTDNRNIIPKVGELKTYIQSLQARMNEAEQAIDELEEQGAVDHLEEAGLVGELYNLSDTLFKQKTPTYANCTVDANIGDVDADKQIHIQRIASGTASNKLKIKAKKVGAPTTGLVVEVRRGVEVDVSSSEAYWYGDELVCSGNIPYSSFTTDYQEFEITMNGQFGGTKGELLDIVIYQTSNIVNSTNYYAVACDSSQYSEGFSFVKVNGTTRTRSKLCPYCIGDGFAQSLLCKTSSRGGGAYVQISLSADNYYNDNPTASTTYTFTQSYSSVSIPMHRTLNGGGAQASHTIAITVKRGNDTIFSKSQVAGYLSPIDTGEMITVADMQIGEVLTFQITVDGRYGESSQNAYGSFTATINGQQAGSVKRNLIPTEVKTLGQQAVATLFGRLGESERYGEITGTTNTATTGNISLGNAVGFITMEYNGYVIKIPYYN